MIDASNLSSFAGETLRPTGTCFDDALDLLQSYSIGSPVEHLTHLRLVHGILTDEVGCEFSHAWVEDLDADEAIFCALRDEERIYVSVPRMEYRKGFRVREATSYTVEQAWNENAKSGHYGPWQDRYQSLCRARRDG